MEKNCQFSVNSVSETRIFYKFLQFLTFETSSRILSNFFKNATMCVSKILLRCCTICYFSRTLVKLPLIFPKFFYNFSGHFLQISVSQNFLKVLPKFFKYRVFQNKRSPHYYIVRAMGEFLYSRRGSTVFGVPCGFCSGGRQNTWTRLTCMRIFRKIVLQYAEEFKGSSSFIRKTI